ncbi:MAG: hypothetical protein HOC20_10965 [Chloroflexi bacterium]|nr:hypothetical protein [Chloroflexota bacterium]
MIKLLVSGMFICLFAAGSVFSAEDDWDLLTIIPKQEAARDSSLVAFLDSLETAIEGRDSVFIYEHFAERVFVSGGESANIEGFRHFWEPHDPGSNFWPNVKRSLKMGGKISIGNEGVASSYSTPYILWPIDLVCEKVAEDGTRYTIQIPMDESCWFVEDTFRILLAPSGYPNETQPPAEILANFRLDAKPIISVKWNSDRRSYISCSDIRGLGHGCRLGLLKSNDTFMISYCTGRFPDLDMRR